MCFQYKNIIVFHALHNLPELLSIEWIYHQQKKPEYSCSDTITRNLLHSTCIPNFHCLLCVSFPNLQLKRRGSRYKLRSLSPSARSATFPSSAIFSRSTSACHGKFVAILPGLIVYVPYVMVNPGNFSFPRWVRGWEWPPRRETSDRSRPNLGEVSQSTAGPLSCASTCHCTSTRACTSEHSPTRPCASHHDKIESRNREANRQPEATFQRYGCYAAMLVGYLGLKHAELLSIPSNLRL